MIKGRKSLYEQVLSLFEDKKLAKKRIKVSLDVKIDDLHKKVNKHFFAHYILKAIIILILAYLTKKL